jgi:LacI family transcriptional regulator
MRARIEDVAQLAQVSTATVSRVLSSPDRVRQERRLRVQQAIKQLGYVPDTAARALASGRTHTVGCVVPFLDQAIFARSTQALQSALIEQNYQLLVATHEYDLQREYESVIALQQRAVDALVLVGTDHLPKTWQAVKRWAKPTVLTWSSDPRLPSIAFDNQALAYELTQHLITLGHRKIGLISGFSTVNDRARSRMQGVKSALEENKLTLPDYRVTEQSFSLNGGRLGLEKLLAHKNHPTAIVCGNDILAVGALLHARRLGISVPQQLSICGIDNNELSQEIVPALTTVSLSTLELGQVTARQLMLALAGKTLRKVTMLTHSLLVRESTAPVTQAPTKPRFSQR